MFEAPANARRLIEDLLSAALGGGRLIGAHLLQGFHRPVVFRGGDTGGRSPRRRRSRRRLGALGKVGQVAKQF